MTKVERFEEFEDVVADVKVGEFGVKCLELGVLRSARNPCDSSLRERPAPFHKLTLTYSDTIEGVLDYHELMNRLGQGPGSPENL
jgi:hypothetical protein